MMIRTEALQPGKDALHNIGIRYSQGRGTGAPIHQETTKNMKAEPGIVDVRKDNNWLDKAIRLYEQRTLRKVTGWTQADIPQIEEFLQCMKERQPKKAPPEIMFSLDLAPKSLAPE